MPYFRTSHPTIWLDALKRLTLAKTEGERLKAGAKKYVTKAANPSPGFLNPGLLNIFDEWPGGSWFVEL